MKEKTLKSSILLLMLIAKIFTIGLILFHYATDGLEKGEAYSILTLILPLFTVYLTVIIKDVLSNPYKEKKKKDQENSEKIEPIRVKNSISVMTFIVFPIYFMALVIIINQTAKGNMQADELQKIVGLIESAFGIYIGQIIMTLFKHKDSKEK